MSLELFSFVKINVESCKPSIEPQALNLQAIFLPITYTLPAMYDEERRTTASRERKGLNILEN